MAFDAGTIEARLTLDRTPFQTGLDEALKEGERFERRRFAATLDANTNPFDRQTRRVKSRMRDIGRMRVDPKVAARVTGGPAVGRLARQLARLRDRTVRVNVRGNFRRELMRFAQFSEQLLLRLMSIKVAGVAALIGLIGPAGAAAGAIGGVSVAALGALGPLAALAVAVARAFKKGGPDIRAFRREARGFGKDFQDALGPGAMEVVRGMTAAIGDLRTTLSPLRTDFTRLGKAVGDAFRGFGAQLSSPRFQVFYKDMTQLATRAVPLLAKAMRNLLDVFRNVATAAGPLLIRSLKMLAAWLGKAAKSTGDIDRLRGAFDRGAKALGQLWRIAKNVGDIFKSLFKAATADGTDFVGLLERTTKKLADFFASAKGQADLRRLFQRLGALLEQIGESLPTILRIFGRLTGVAAELLRLVLRVLTTIERIPVVGPALATVAAAFILWKSPLGAASVALRSIWRLLGKIKAARVTGALVPGVAGGGVVASRGGRAAAGSSTGGVPAVFTRGGGKTTAAAKTAGVKAGRAGFLAGFLSSISRGWGRVLGKLKGLLGRIGPLLKKIPGLAKIGGLFAAAFAKIGPKLGGVLKRALRKLPALFRVILPRILGVVLGWPVAIGLLLYTLLPKKVKDAIKKGIGKALSAVRDAGAAVAKGIGKGLAAAGKFVWSAVKKIATRGWKLLRAAASKFLGAGKFVIGRVAKGVKAAAKAVWGAVKKIATRGWKLLRAAASKYLGAGKFVITRVAKGVKAAAKAVWGAIKAVGKKGWEKIKGFGKRFFEAGKALVTKLIDGIKSMVGAAKDAVGGLLGGVVGLLPGSEPRDPASPLRRLDRRGKAIVDNIGKGVRSRRDHLRSEMVATLKAAYAPVRDMARTELAGMDRQDRARQGPAPSRAQREGEAVSRIAAARFATDDQGRLLNQPPPGVARVPSGDEREAIAELQELRRDNRREDLEAAVNFNVRTLLPSDPRIMREAQRGMARSARHGRRRRRRRRRKT